MARGVELATAYVSVAAETSDLSKGIGQAFAGANKTAAKAGKSMGQAVSRAYNSVQGPDFDQLAADAKKADDQVAASAERSAKVRDDAARKVEIAEKRVQEVRERSIRQDAEVKAAEKALSDARKASDPDEITRAEKALADARDAAKPTSADMSAEDRLTKARDAQKLATQKAEGELKGYQDAQERANKSLRDAKDAADSAETSTVKAGNAFQRMGGRVQAALRGDFKGAFKGVERESNSAAREVEADFDEAGDNSGEGMLGGLKGALLGAAGALGIGASFGEMFQQGMESVSSTAKLKASLGLSDKDAAQLGKDAAAAYKNGFGEDLASASEATGAVRQYLGPDVDTQWATEMSLAMSDAFGNDPQENIKAVAQLIRTGMVDDAQEGFDVLTKGFQSGANKADDLTDTMSEYGTLFRNLGFSGSDAIGLMSQGLNAGARDADKVADAFKEFGIRAVDGSKLTSESFALLGLDADDMAQRIGAGGSTARDATQEVLEKLGGVEDPALRAQIAVGLFGTQAEDLGGALYALDLDTAASGMGKVGGSTQEMADALSEAQSPLERIKRSFSDIGTSIGSGMLGPLNVFADVVIRIGEFFRANPLVFAVVAAGIVAMGIAAGISTGAFSGLAAAIWAATGPVGLIILGITAVVAALVWFFTKTELGQAIIQKVWGAIKVAISAVVGWITGTAWPALKTAWDAIAAAAVWLYQNAILPAWNGIKTAIGAVANWVMTVLVPWFQSAWTAIGNAAKWLYNTIILPVWTAIRIAIAIVVTAIMTYMDLVIWVFQKLVAPVFRWFYNSVIKPVWNAIKTAIGAVVTWFRDTVWPIISTVITWLRNKFEQFKLGLQVIWRFIKNNVIAPVVNWFRNVVWPLLSAVITWIRIKFDQFRLGLAIIWNFIKNRVIAPVVNWFRDVVWPLFSRIVNSIRNKFSWFRDRLRDIWNYIRYTIVAPVINWFKNTVQSKISDFTSAVKSAFDTLKDGVLDAWNSIKSGMKKPINGVIGIYNEHIRGNFNKVAKTLGLADKYKLDKMDEFATGGYTGAGSKYQPAGVVHADEFVIRKESQNDLRRNAPGLLDSLNRHGSKALGYANGGRVKLRMPFSGSYGRGDGFGARGGNHKGIDWPMPSGTVLKAVGAGVASRSYNSAAGNKLELSLGDGLVAGYHHLSSYIAKSGQSVGRGTDVARVGSTGRSSGPHLHFSLKRDGNYVDPAPYLGAGGSAGSGGGGIWNPFAGLWGKIKNKVSDAVGGGTMGGMLTKTTSNTVTGIKDWVVSKLAAVGDFASTAVAGVAGRAKWSPVMTQALAMKGEFGPNRLRWGLDRLMQESGGDPNAVNNWDSNARRGTPSKGLMQVIGPTFRAYAEPGYSSNILDPLSNILASINYTLATYGSLKGGWTRKGGYASGGLVKPFLHDNGGWHNPGELSVNQTRKPEAVLTNEQWATMSEVANETISRGQTIVQVMPPSTEDPGTWGRRVAESLDLHTLANAGGY